MDEATPKYLLASVSRMLGRVSNSSKSRSALSTDSMGYCGGGPYRDVSFCSNEGMDFIVLGGGGIRGLTGVAAFNTAHRDVPVRASKRSRC